MQSYSTVGTQSEYEKTATRSHKNILCKLLLYISVSLTEKPTLLRVRGAVTGVLGRGDSLRVSEVELRDELLLERSLFALLKLEDS